MSNDPFCIPVGDEQEPEKKQSTEKIKKGENARITFDKDAFVIVCDLLGIKEPKCEYCKEPITKDNCGGFQKLDKLMAFCNSPLCIAEHLDFEDEYNREEIEETPRDELLKRTLNTGKDEPVKNGVLG